MAKKRGCRIEIPFSRRCMIDFMYFSQKMSKHLVSAELNLDLSELARAREKSQQKISWFAIYIKAFAMVSAKYPELRQVLFSYPFPYLYQYQRTVAMLAIEREIEQENMVMYLKIDSPEKLSLESIHQMIHESKTMNPQDNLSFRRFLKFNRFPFLLRRLYWWMGVHLPMFKMHYFGTFGVTGAGRGLRSLTIKSPVGVNFVFDTASGLFRLFWDHRLFDGVIVTRMLNELQHIFDTTILKELKDMEKLENGVELNTL
jgi:hypothetical protein